MVSVTESVGDFPVWGLLPRKETGALNLIKQNSSYDGSDVVIAIFDSGIDPSTPGLQFTPKDKVKVIDRIDASGAGDVDTSTVIEVVSNGSIKGLTGRQLVIPKSWKNPSGKYHLGVVHAYNLYPQKLRERITKERKEKKWDDAHRECLSKAQKKSQAFDKSKVGDNAAGDSIGNNNSNNNNRSSSPKTEDENETNSPDPKSDTTPVPLCLNLMEKLLKENTEAELSLLKQLDKKYNDLGPTYDCVVFHNGTCWSACIDTSEEGDLANAPYLQEYYVTHDYKVLNKFDQYIISINVHNNGDLLEIVGMCSSHGTHVASIAAGYFPDEPEKNGVAPGAKIVSITIGDNRLGSMETGTALVRAMSRVMENPYYKVDVINMSYGEHAHWSHSGRLGEIAHDVVNKYGVVWVSSAGNHGPALCTVGVPPDFFSDCIIGVGAYVTPDMMSAEYSMTDKLPGRPYTWSSRGPTTDGGRGISVCAPGGAITSVPRFTLKSNQLMNGTSMASPHTAGCVALLISALKQKKISYSPYFIRRAIQNTAMPLDTDIFAQGHGLIKVDKALNYLIEHKEAPENNIRFKIECGKERGKGIYMRNWLADKPVDVPITVEPYRFNETDETDEAVNEKINMNIELALLCDDTWVKCPPFLQSSYTSRVFKVSIDPRGLERGRAYFSSVRAYLTGEPEKGMLFEIPITVIAPHVKLPLEYQFIWEPTVYKSGHVQRHFIMVPLEATYAFIAVKASGSDKTQRFTLHTVQIKPSCSVTTLEFYKVLNLGHNECTAPVIAVQGGLTLEICLARWWSCLAEGKVEISVEFHSLYTTQEMISFASSDGFHRVDVKSGLRTEELLPQAVLKHHSQVLMPSESKIEVLGGERDTVPSKRIIYQIILTYNLSINKNAAEVTPKCCLLNHVLYESSFESQLWMLFDCNKQLLATGDAYCSKYSCKLDKGSYVIKLHIRHERVDMLEKLNETPLTILSKLSQEVKLDMFSSYTSAVTGGRKVQSLVLSQGSIQPFYISPPNLTDKTLKSLALSSGDCLVGSVSFGKDENVRKADYIPLKVFITELPNKKKNQGTSDEKKDGKTYAEYEEALREFQTSWLAKLEPESSVDLSLFMGHSYDNHSAAQLGVAQSCDNGEEAYLPNMLKACEHIVRTIDINTLLTYYGTKTDMRQDANKIKTQMDRQKNILLEAKARQGSAMYTVLGHSDCYMEDVQALDQIAADIMKFTDPSDSKVINFFINYYTLHNFHCLTCRLLTKMNDEKPTKETDNRLIDMYKKLEWEHASKFFTTIQHVKYPPNYSCF